MFLHGIPQSGIRLTTEEGFHQLLVHGIQPRHLKGHRNDQPQFMGLIKVEKKAMKVSLLDKALKSNKDDECNSNGLNAACCGFNLSIILVVNSTHHELVEGNGLKSF